MNNLIRKIREKLNLRQVEFGEKLGVSFSTVNRWENGRAYPNKLAQLRIAELALDMGIDITEMIYDRILQEAEEIRVEKERILLYHGSKSGLTGEIHPISRARCDFGKGFYMGTIPQQPLTLICDYDEAKFYIVSVDMKDLTALKIQPDLDWAMFVAYNRGRMDEAKGTAFYQKYQAYAQRYDMIIGNIANDRMFFVLDNFFQGNVTDQALIQSLSALQLGQQYVAVTEKACKNIRIEKEIKISFLEKQCLLREAEKNRRSGISMANEICRAHRRDGKYFDEILAEAKEGV